MSLIHPPISVNNAPHWLQMLLNEFGYPKPDCYVDKSYVPCWWVSKILDLDKIEQARKYRRVFKIKIPDEMKVMRRIRTRLS